MNLTIDTLVLGPLEVNTYVLRAGGDCWVVDPAGMDGGELLRFLRQHRLAPGRVLLTHGHGDHIAGVPELKTAFPSCVVCCPQGDADMLGDPRLNMSAAFGVSIIVNPADELVCPGQVMTCGPTEWVVIDTSGHTEGGVSYYCKEAKVVLTGDALFAGSIGRTDVPGGHIGRLLKHIRLNLMSLDEDTRVLCGHGPETTIGHERRTNPFMKEFYKLRPQ